MLAWNLDIDHNVLAIIICTSFLQIITNGKYRSIEHRATVNSEKERLSIATFLSPNYDGVIGPAPSLVTEQTPAMFKSTTTEEYFKGLFARELHEKSYLDVMRI
jgi:isopenicillin N synthase-like dioxygenase